MSLMDPFVSGNSLLIVCEICFQKHPTWLKGFPYYKDTGKRCRDKSNRCRRGARYLCKVVFSMATFSDLYLGFIWHVWRAILENVALTAMAKMADVIRKTMGGNPK